MGNLLCKRLFSSHPTKILFTGLDAAGKTTALYQLKLGEVVTTIPTIGFNVETLSHKGVELVAWDVGCRGKTRALIHHYYHGTDAVICMIDCSDRERFDEAIEDIIKRNSEEVKLRDVIYLILANKQDLKGAMTRDDVTKVILEKGYLKNFSWNVFGTCANSGSGLYEAFDWLTEQIVNKHKYDGVKTLVQPSLDDQNESTESDQGPKDVSKWLYMTDFISSFKRLLVGNDVSKS